ncbi:hypothetical protein JZU61_03615, partial [bacterium]|nr:hypothetical protein [bacterium]
MRHIEQFEALCDTTQATGASLEFFRCTLFPFSLEGKAEQWLGSLPPGSLTSWRECKSAFLKHYYTKGKTAQLRSRISTFKQMSGESFTEAWGRFKEYIRECPHHSFQDEQLMRMFYDGVEWQYKVALNSASNGDFATQSSEGARELINNLASSLEESSPEYDRTRKVNSVSTPSIEELAAQVQELLRLNGAQKEVHMVAEPDTGYYQEPPGSYIESQEEVSYVNGQGYGQNRGFNPNYRNHPNLSYRSTNVANPQDQIYPPAPQNQQQLPKQYGPNQNYQSQQNAGFQNQQGQGFQNNYVPQYQPRPFNNQGQNNQQNYAPRAPQQMQNAPPPTQQPRTTLEDIKTLFFNGQMEITKAMQEVKGEIRSTRTELESKLDALETRVKMAET